MASRFLTTCATTLVAASLAACAFTGEGGRPADAPAKELNGVLVAPDGRTLYTFERDKAGSGASMCMDACATNWPPLLAPAEARNRGYYSVIRRPDGTRQWAYKGHPLYYWAKDNGVAGDRSGDGVNNVWRLARP